MENPLLPLQQLLLTSITPNGETKHGWHTSAALTR
jgi:hypothetical protein